MKEDEIRKRDVFNRYLKLVEIDAEVVFRDKSTFQTICCPACGCDHNVAQFDKSGFHYVQCSKCDTLFVNPRPTYENLMQIYTDSLSTKFWVEEFFLPMAEARREKIFKPRAQYITEKFPQLQAGIIGDIGAGFGIFPEELKKIWPDSNIIAIEPSIDMAKICRDRGLAVIESTMENIDPNCHKFDLLTAFELFEHLHDPSAFVRKVSQFLNVGGYLYLTTLNGLGFDIQLLWERSKSVMPPHHLNFFNTQSIRLMLEKMGFTLIEVSTPGQLDWDIVESGYRQESLDPGRFFSTVSKYGSAQAKKDLQSWIGRHNFSSHMRVIAQKN
ncbi:MAG: class I SAM-dependent methyltransferase [Pseudomonadota bacterium]